MAAEATPTVFCPRCSQELLDTFIERLEAAMDIKATRDAVHAAIEGIVDWSGLTPEEHADWERILAISRLIRERWAIREQS